MARATIFGLASTVLVTVSLCAQGPANPMKKPPPPFAPLSAPQFHFSYATDPAGKIRQVLVDRDDKQVQSLEICTSQAIPRENGLGELTQQDFNFDGYPDLMMRVAFDPRTNNSSYCIWLYDPATQKFVLSEELSHLTNPVPDPDSKTVFARKNIICSERCYVEDVYAWTNGHLEPIWEQSLTEDPVAPPGSDCRWVWAAKKEKNGKLMDVDRQRVDIGGVMCEPHTAWLLSR